MKLKLFKEHALYMIRWLFGGFLKLPFDILKFHACSKLRQLQSPLVSRENLILQA